MKTNEIVSQLKATAAANGLRLNFSKEGRVWIATDFKGRQIWGGTLKEIRRVAAGKVV